MPMITKGTAALTRTAGEVRRYRIWKRMIPVICACIAVLITLIYIVAVLYTKFASFTVSVNKYHQLKYGLSLSEKADFQKPTVRLECRASEEITNIDGKFLDGEKLGATDGVDSGENYLCYTFYCKNMGTEPVSYSVAMNIANMTMGVEEAIRVRLISNINGENGKSVDYARAAGVDENGNAIPEPDTVPFYSKYTVMEEEVTEFQPGDISKYTVVIWLEGNDPECLDNIIGGEFKVDMNFTVTSVADLDEA